MSETIGDILIKRLFGPISAQEQKLLDNHAAKSKANRTMVETYTDKKRVLAIVKESEQWSTEEAWRKIEQNLPATMGDERT